VPASLTDERANTIFFGSGSASKTWKLEEMIEEGEGDYNEDSKGKLEVLQGTYMDGYMMRYLRMSTVWTYAPSPS